MGRRVMPSDAELRGVFDRYADLSNQRLADRFGWKEWTVKYHRRRLGFEAPSKRRMPPDDVLVGLFAANRERPAKWFADQLGVHVSTVQRYRRLLNRPGRRGGLGPVARMSKAEFSETMRRAQEERFDGRRP